MDDQPIQDPTCDLNAIDDPEERYKALGKDAKASVALRNIATYFVKSNRTGYPSNNTETITVGTLDHAEAERQFAAQFDFDDILAPTTPSTATLRSPATNSSPSWARSSTAGRKPA